MIDMTELILPHRLVDTANSVVGFHLTPLNSEPNHKAQKRDK